MQKSSRQEIFFRALRNEMFLVDTGKYDASYDSELFEESFAVSRILNLYLKICLKCGIN